MSGNNAGRGLLMTIFKNFINSLRPRQVSGNIMGTDHFGNTYYEIPADRNEGRRRIERWFIPKEKDAFDQELPAEWESWLRGRRLVPPTEEEIKKNLAIIEMKRKNWAELEAKYSTGKLEKLQLPKAGPESFPKYDEYEQTPGEKIR